MKFRPLHDRVLVRRVDQLEKTAGGIIIPDTAKEKPQEAEVVALGTGKKDENGKVQAFEVKVGDRVDKLFADQPGVLNALSGFFSSRGIDIGDITTRTYNAAHTGAPMFSVYMVVHVPTRVHIAALREEFLDLCDHLNLDAILEPLKS